MDAIYHLDFTKIVEISKYSNEDWLKLIQTKYRRLLSGETSILEEDNEISNEELEMLYGFMEEQFNESIALLVESAINGWRDQVHQCESKLISLLLLNDGLSQICIWKMREYKVFINQESETSVKSLLNIILYTDNPFLIEKTFQLISSLTNQKTILKLIKAAFKSLIGNQETTYTDIEASIFTPAFYQNPNPFNHLRELFKSGSGYSIDSQSSSSNHVGSNDGINTPNIVYVINRKKVILNINIDEVCGDKPSSKSQTDRSQPEVNSTQEELVNINNANSSDIANQNNNIQQLQQQQFNNNNNNDNISNNSNSNRNDVNGKENLQKKQKNQLKLVLPSYYVAKQLIGNDAEVQDIFRVQFLIKMIRGRDSMRSFLMHMLSYFTIFSDRREMCMSMDFVQIIKQDLNCYVPCLLLTLLDDLNNIKRESKSLFQAFICSPEYQQSLSSNDMKRFIVNTIETDRFCFKYIEHDIDINTLPFYIRSLYSFQRIHKKLISCESQLSLSIELHYFLTIAFRSTSFNLLLSSIQDSPDKKRKLNQLYMECIHSIQSFFSTPDLSKQLQKNIILPYYTYKEKKKEEDIKKRRRRREEHQSGVDANNNNNGKEKDLFDQEPLPSLFETIISNDFDSLPGLVKFYIALFLSEVAPSLYLEIFHKYLQIAKTGEVQQNDNKHQRQYTNYTNQQQEDNTNQPIDYVSEIHSTTQLRGQNEKIKELETENTLSNEYQQEMQKLNEFHPVFEINKSTQLTHLYYLAKQAKTNSEISFQLFRLTNNLQINTRLSFLQIQNQLNIIDKIISHPCKEFRQKSLPILEKLIQLHSSIYEDMKKRVSKLHHWELNIFNTLASFNNDLLGNSDGNITQYLEKQIIQFAEQQDKTHLFPILLLSCKIFQRTPFNDSKEETFPVKERIFFTHLADYPEFCKMYYLLNVRFKIHLRSIWNYFCSKHPDLLIKEICLLNFVRSSCENSILEQNKEKGLSDSQKEYFLFLKRNSQLVGQIPKDLDLRLSSDHSNLHNKQQVAYLTEIYSSTCLYYQVMSQSEFNENQQADLLISFFNSLIQLKDSNLIPSLLLNKKLFNNVSKIILCQNVLNQDLLIKVLNIMDLIVHQSICEFKINLFIQLDFLPLLQTASKSQNKEILLFFQYLDLVFYDALLTVEKDKKSRRFLDENDYETLSDLWVKTVIENVFLLEYASQFRVNRISQLYHKFQHLENNYSFKIFNFKEYEYPSSLSVYKNKFNMSDFYPEFKSKFDALMYYGILIRHLISYATIKDFQIIKNAIQFIIDDINSVTTENLIQLSYIWKNVTNLLGSKLIFDFRNLELLVDLEKQIQKKLKNNQKQILSFNDQITLFLDNIKDIFFSETTNQDFLKVNCELKIKKLFYLESEQKIKKTIKTNQIKNLLDFPYGETVAKVLLKPLKNNSVFIELLEPQEFHKIQTISSREDCQKSLSECNSITTKLMEWMDYFLEFSKISDSAKKTIISLFEVLKIICAQYPLAVQHIVASNFHVKLLDITHSLRMTVNRRMQHNLQQPNFSPFELIQDYAFYEISSGMYSSSSLCLKNHLIQHLIEVFQQTCIDSLQKLQDKKISILSVQFEIIQNKCSYIQNQIIQILVDIPKNLSQSITLQILSNCEFLFQKYSPHFIHLQSLLNLSHLTLNFLIQSFSTDSLFIPSNLLKLRYHQYLSFNSCFKEKEEILRMRERMSGNKIEQQINVKGVQSIPFLEQDCFSKLSCELSPNSESEDKIEESKIQEIDIDCNIGEENISFQQSIMQLVLDNTDDEISLLNQYSDIHSIDSKINFNFNYDLKDTIKQPSISPNQQEYLNDKCIQEILLKFPVFTSTFFEEVLESTNQMNSQTQNQLLITLMNHPWNCMELLNIVFIKSFQNPNYVQENVQYNSLVEIALKNSLIHYPLSKGIFCKKSNQIILGEHNLQVDLTKSIFEMDQIPLIQILLRSPQFSKIQEHVWLMIKNDVNVEFPGIYQKVVITQNLVDMIVQDISPEKFPQIIMNLTENQGQIIDVVKHLTVHLEETNNSSIIYYSLYALRRTLEKFISELSQEEDALSMVNHTLSPLREWIIGRKEFVDKQLTNMLKKCTQFIQDQVSKFYPMRQEQFDDIEIDLENVSKNFQVLWKIITNIRKEIKMDIQALAEINLILNYDFLETGQLPIMRQRKQSNEVSLTTNSLDKNSSSLMNTNLQQYHSEDEFSEDFLISKLASMNEITRKSVSFESQLWDFFEQISETLGPEIIGRDVYIHLLNLLKPSLKKSELMRHVRSIVYGNQFTFAKQSRQVSILRDNIWDSTIEEMKTYTTDQWLRAVFSIKFKSKIGEHVIDEIGIDAGGLKNHWITKVVEQTFMMNRELFTFTSDQMSVFPNKEATSKKQLEEIELLGKFVGKSMMDDWSLMVNFAPFFVKSVLKRDLSIGDFYSYDYQTAQQHQWLLENEIDNLDLGLTFSYTSYSQGTQKVYELKKDGQNIDVDDSNKKEYIQLYCKAKMQDEIALQTSHFQKGLFSIIPQDALEALEPQDFVSFYQGVQNIDVSYLQKKMKYEGFKVNDKVIDWFWEIQKEWDNPQKRRFLSALTEIPGIPVGGYPVRDVATGNVKQLTISYLNSNPESLPVWHTCFFRVDIPKYNSKEQMKLKLEQSINLSSGFHIA